MNMDEILRKDREDFYKRIGAVPIPENMLKEWTGHVERVVIPEIEQAIRDRIPTQEQIKKIFY